MIGEKAMSEKSTEDRAMQTDGASVKKRPGRKPMTPEEKEAMAKARAAEKARADNLKPELFIQFQENQADLNVLVEQAKADFRSVKKRTLVTSLKLYVKPEERTAYYVINETYTGQVQF